MLQGRPGEYRFLSCRPNYGDHHDKDVDLWTPPDGSGRQLWWVIPHAPCEPRQVLGKTSVNIGRFHIVVSGGREGRRVLSCPADSDRVDMAWTAGSEQASKH